MVLIRQKSSLHHFMYIVRIDNLRNEHRQKIASSGPNYTKEFLTSFHVYISIYLCVTTSEILVTLKQNKH